MLIYFYLIKDKSLGLCKLSLCLFWTQILRCVLGVLGSGDWITMIRCVWLMMIFYIYYILLGHPKILPLHNKKYDPHNLKMQVPVTRAVSSTCRPEITGTSCLSLWACFSFNSTEYRSSYFFLNVYDILLYVGNTPQSVLYLLLLDIKSNQPRYQMSVI